MNLKEYLTALNYAKLAYVRRDVMFAMSGKKKKGKGKGNLNFTIEQPGIEAWIAKEYENVKENTKV